jgi:ferredoxin
VESSCRNGVCTTCAAQVNSLISIVIWLNDSNYSDRWRKTEYYLSCSWFRCCSCRCWICLCMPMLRYWTR